jgi:hypothetical protein
VIPFNSTFAIRWPPFYASNEAGLVYPSRIRPKNTFVKENRAGGKGGRVKKGLGKKKETAGKGLKGTIGIRTRVLCPNRIKAIRVNRRRKWQCYGALSRISKAAGEPWGG